MEINKDKFNDTMKDFKGKAKETAKNMGEKAAKAGQKVSLETVKIIDENGNGRIDLEDFIIKALKVPGVKINRAEYLSKALMKYCDDNTIKKAIAVNPAKAGVSREIVDKVANESIAYQKSTVTAISAGFGAVPGGLAIDISTTVADLAQYSAQQLIIMQKLMYLYGYPEISIDGDKSNIDDGTMNMIVICIGVMAGVKEATKYITKITTMLAEGVKGPLLKMALTKTTAYKVAKKVAEYLGIKLTKTVAIKGVSNSIKLLGPVLVGGISLVTFSASCDNFHKAIKDTPLSDPDYFDETNMFDSEYRTVEDVEAEIAKDIIVEEENAIEVNNDKR